MARAKYQVLVLPYQNQNNKTLYCIFKRSDMDAWQFIAGGGETEDASPLISAKREANEEAGISCDKPFHALETTSSISTEGFKKARPVWERPAWSSRNIALRWNCPTGPSLSPGNTPALNGSIMQRLSSGSKYDSNKVALWELENKIRMGLLS